MKLDGHVLQFWDHFQVVQLHVEAAHETAMNNVTTEILIAMTGAPQHALSKQDTNALDSRLMSARRSVETHYKLDLKDVMTEINSALMDVRMIALLLNKDGIVPSS